MKTCIHGVNSSIYAQIFCKPNGQMAVNFQAKAKMLGTTCLPRSSYLAAGLVLKELFPFKMLSTKDRLHISKNVKLVIFNILLKWILPGKAIYFNPLQ